MSTAPDGSPRAPELLPGVGDVRPRPLPAHRTLLLCLALLVIGVALEPQWRSPATTAAAVGLDWWQLAVVFALAGVFVFHVEIDSEAHTFSLSEVPFVLGLLFASPAELLIARLVGEAVVLIAWERQSPTKLAFNLSLFFAEISTALAVFGSIHTGASPLHWTSWLAALVAVSCSAVLGAAAVWTVIRLHHGEVSPRTLIMTAAVTALGNTGLAVVAAVLLMAAPLALIPLSLVAGVVVSAYRGYTRLTRRYAGLELLYQFTRITGGSQRPEETLQRVLHEASRLLRTDRAMIALYEPGQELPWMFLDTGGSTPSDDAPLLVNLPADLRRRVLDGGPVLIPRTVTDAGRQAVLRALHARDCMAAPLISGGEVTGVMVVCDRLGEVSTFDAEDGRLFATLASQAAVALENGRLIDRLHTQIQAREHEALHDALTGLPNRTLFYQRLRRALEDSASGGEVAILVLDLDGFKDVNDTLGHHSGDHLLCEVSGRLAAVVEDQGTVARLGGDEFAVLLPTAGSESGEAVAHRIIEAIRRPVTLSSMTLTVGASIGMALAPRHGTDPDGLLQRADVAMYQAKRAQSGVEVYDPDTDWNSQYRLRLAGELRAAVTRGEIEVWYQPIARTADVEVTGVEALARWHHAELGPISPGEFIPVAERTGLIHELTLYVLDRALAQVRAWHDVGLSLGVSVNLPPQVLRDVEWPVKVVEMLHRHDVQPRWLTLEITESGIMTDPERMISILRELTSTGVSLSIDDFGTGYSSLAYLQQLPVSTVKIDQSFVTPLLIDPAAAAIVGSVIDLARSLGLAVVAEGVEDQRTLEHLAAIDCHFVQGFLLSRPTPGGELTSWLTMRRHRRQRLGGVAG
ncbi:MAG: EAL domain-containing protein [Kineosporiaceae bacterium]